MKIKAIPTKYAGVQFRSRLEARWAAFFDLCGWVWEYEPFDLDGWIPDFKIEGDDGSLLVEIKPISEFDSAVGKKIESACLASEYEGEMLLLGLAPDVIADPYHSDWACGTSFGWLAERMPTGARPDADDWEWGWDEACVGYGSAHDDFIDVGAAEGSYAGRLFGNYDGNPMTIDPSSLKMAWKEAVNKVQFCAGDKEPFRQTLGFLREPKWMRMRNVKYGDPVDDRVLQWRSRLKTFGVQAKHLGL